MILNIYLVFAEKYFKNIILIRNIFKI